MTGSEQRAIYGFGPFRVDAADRVLTRDQEVIPLNLKTFEILVALIENAGRVLTKDLLMKKVWPDTFVEEGNLTKGIFVLRRILGNKPGGGPWIETLPKRGYRFSAPITIVGNSGSGDSPAPLRVFCLLCPLRGTHSWVGRRICPR